jgi:hypothetical protein
LTSHVAEHLRSIKVHLYKNWWIEKLKGRYYLLPEKIHVNILLKEEVQFVDRITGD